MLLVSASRTMANAKFRIEEPETPVNLIEVNRVRREAADRARRDADARYQQQLADERQRLREMMEAANKAAARSRQEWLEQEMEPKIPQQRRLIENPTSLARITRLVSRATGISIATIIGPRGNVKASFARQAVMYWACRRTDLSLVEIGRAINRDHTSVMHGKNEYPKKRKAMGRTLREVR